MVTRQILTLIAALAVLVSTARAQEPESTTDGIIKIDARPASDEPAFGGNHVFALECDYDPKRKTQTVNVKQVWGGNLKEGKIEKVAVEQLEGNYSDGMQRWLLKNPRAADDAEWTTACFIATSQNGEWKFRGFVRLKAGIFLGVN